MSKKDATVPAGLDPTRPIILPDRLSYEQMRELAGNENAAVRVALARHPDTQPEVLYFLAEDTDPDVRRAVARNDRTPRQADLVLTKDHEVGVRGDLAAKIARLTPDMAEDQRSTLYRLTVEALEVLAEDQLVQVRRILADALKDVANAPASVIRLLAHDSELSVAQPVLEFSPVLSDDDLLSIIRSSPIQGALAAISRRGGVAPGLSEAIVQSGDEQAISALLANPSAQLREETLDIILDKAPGVESWHEPLVVRPKLSPKAARRIASFVAMHLLDRLQKRVDLDDETLIAVAQAVERRIESENKERPEPEWADQDDVEDRVDQLAKAGKLDAKAIEMALAKGEKRFVVLALAMLADLPSEMVGEIVARRVPKALVALTWRASLRPHLANQLQIQLAGIPPETMIRVDGPDWPMKPEDMAWQIDFYREPLVKRD
ncbi:DUF2336 domain-containing protein [Marivibrio halodurans]|uniref:DUF2336 domain-containing protein n=1 Tax=Marivibrio halodurans TaxID=2039722 RepID=A0A8J7V3L9_9PROT|nr:DUF2336 domain-containing protein [Marivibrio halodurans]MBP5858102.1 DUF2336 domain-containing protein [Marivibrio halodurans]